MFYYAQKAVLHPTTPLYNYDTQEVMLLQNVHMSVYPVFLFVISKDLSMY